MTTPLTTPPVADHGRTRMLVDSPLVRVGLGAAAFVTAGLTASSDDGIVLCPIRRCTGGYCPGCGLTRSAGKLIRGDLVGSWHHHPFLVLAVAQALVLGALWASGSRLWDTVAERWVSLLRANVVLLGGLYLLRLLLGDIPVPFANGPGPLFPF
ncbi:MAG: DUF2752 domain-containing protein [Actinomycetota bacterium]